MRFSLVGTLVQSGGHDNDKIFLVEEYFDADNLETAIVVSKAMIQSQKLRQEKHNNSVSELSAVLNNDNGQVVWKTKLEPAKYHPTTIETVEHFIEEEMSL